MPVGYGDIHSFTPKQVNSFLAKCRTLSQSDDILDDYASFTPDSGSSYRMAIYLHRRDPP